jgi:hypothetical protein
LTDHNYRHEQVKTTETKKKWATFTYFNPSVRKINNIFWNKCIAFRPTNTISKYMKEINTLQNELGKSGICKILCHTCGLKYVGQTSRDLTTCFYEHRRYIKTNNPKSAYALHILNNRHEYGPATNAIRLLQKCKRNKKLTQWENFFIQNYHNNKELVQEQTLHEYNILYDLST